MCKHCADTGGMELIGDREAGWPQSQPRPQLPGSAVTQSRDFSLLGPSSLTASTSQNPQPDSSPPHT